MPSNASICYLDHAATTFPRPGPVISRMAAEYERLGCSPGRGGYDLAVEAEAFVHTVRRRLALFFQAPDPDRVTFAANATDALNMAIFGLIRPGLHVVSTRLEHNSVLRPLHHLKQMGMIDLTLAPFDGDGFVDPDGITALCTRHTGLVVVNHASNVLGSVQSIKRIGALCAERGVPLLVDAAQSAGHVPICMTDWHVSALAFTGHKALLGPSGIGGLVTMPDLEIAPTRFGGTGVDSRNPLQPREFPHRLEAGTLNLLGIIGLNAGLDCLIETGVAEEHWRQMTLLSLLRQGLSGMKSVRVYGAFSGDRHVPILTFNIPGIDPNDVGMILDGDHDIAVRSGFHCAPLVHEDIGTTPHGAVRVSLGWNTTRRDIDHFLNAISHITAGR